jgi:hypothetical protein
MHALRRLAATAMRHAKALAMVTGQEHLGYAASKRSGAPGENYLPADAHVTYHRAL